MTTARDKRYGCVCPSCNQSSMQNQSIAMVTGQNVKYFKCPNCGAELEATLWPDIDGATEMIATETGNYQEDLMARQLADGIEV